MWLVCELWQQWITFAESLISRNIMHIPANSWVVRWFVSYYSTGFLLIKQKLTLFWHERCDVIIPQNILRSHTIVCMCNLLSIFFRKHTAVWCSKKPACVQLIVNISTRCNVLEQAIGPHILWSIPQAVKCCCFCICYIVSLQRRKKWSRMSETHMMHNGNWITSPHYESCIIYPSRGYNYNSFECVFVCVCVISMLFFSHLKHAPEVQIWYYSLLPCSLVPNWSLSSRHFPIFDIIHTSSLLLLIRAAGEQVEGTHTPHFVTVSICLWFTLPPCDLSFPSGTVWSICKTNVDNLGLTCWYPARWTNQC